MSENRTIRELSQNELREIRSLATGMCANYSDYYKECVLLDRPCYMFNVRYAGSGMCKYFRSAVLPLNPALEAALNGENTAEYIKKCDICGKELYTESNKRKYCTLCARQIHRRQKTESEQKRRLDVDK